MENTVDDLFLSKVPVVTIDEDLKKYRNSSFVKRKLKRANEILAESGMPDLYYLENEAQSAAAATAVTNEKVNHYESLDLEVQELNENDDVTTKYGSSKPMEQDKGQE